MKSNGLTALQMLQWVNMAEPSQHQLSFDFERFRESEWSSEFNAVRYETAHDGVSTDESGVSRFVRTVNECITVQTPMDAAYHLITNVFSPFEAFDHEEMWVLLLNTRNRITHDAMIYRGTVNSIYVRPAEFFKDAIRFNAPSMILSHNHPSGDPTPSGNDIIVSKDAVAAANLLGINLLDHIVVGSSGRWVSMKEKHLGFS